MRIAPVLVLLLASPAAHADRRDHPRFTGTLDFAFATIPVTGTNNVAAPGGHFDLGRDLGDLRVQAELDVAMLTDGRDHPSDVEPPTGSFTRVGAAIRWNWMDLDTRHTGLRLYVEAGAGREWISLPGVSIARNDLAFGFGFAQALPLGGAFLGGHTGVRVVVSGADATDSPACRGSCPGSGGRLPGVALFYVLGMVVGS